MTMNRRHFLSRGGVVLGGCFLGSGVGIGATARDGARFGVEPMALPDRVLAVTDGGEISLESDDRQTWLRDAVEVRFRREAGALAVDVRCPQSALRAVVAVWRRPTPAGALHLGDAWERAYGDLAWRKPDAKRVLPWYFLEYNGMWTQGFGVKTGCRALCFWRVEPEELRLVLDTRCGGQGVLLGRRRLRAAELVSRPGRAGETAFAAAQDFCRGLCDQPRLPGEPMVGMLDWYYAYGNSTAKLFVEEASLFARLVEGCGVKAFALVDSGWAPRDSRPDDVGWHDDQTRTRPFFGSMPDVAAKVRALGLAPGVWIRPLCAHPKDPAEICLTRDRRLLDPSLRENLVRIRDLARLMRRWGFDVIKHDYTTYDLFGRWGFEMGDALTSEGWAFRDRTRTTAEVVLALYQAIRQGCARDGTIIGCNTLSHLSAGCFEYCRVGDDSGNNLERAMKYGPNPFAFRLPQHRAFYAADPDCIGNLKEIPWKYNRQFLRLVSESGALIQLSTRLGGLEAEHRAEFRAAFQRVARAPRRVEPLDWMERTIPARWRIGDAEVAMDWDLTKP